MTSQQFLLQTFTTTTRNPQGFPLLCKLRILPLHLNLAGITEKDSGRSSKMTP